MQSLIASYLLLSKDCVLPGIGTLKVIATPASTDHDNNKLLPPFHTIIFSDESRSTSDGLIKYISQRKNISASEADDLLDKFCNEWKERINAGEKLHLETIGSIYKNEDGTRTFERENTINYLKPIAIDKVYNRETLLVPEPAEPEVEEETIAHETNTIEEKVEENVVIEKSYWGLWALILLAIGSVVLFYHFKDHKVSVSSVGNQHHNIVDSATATYKTR